VKYYGTKNISSKLKPCVILFFLIDESSLLKHEEGTDNNNRDEGVILSYSYGFTPSALDDDSLILTRADVANAAALKSVLHNYCLSLG
jgi:hypothetical protein